MVLAGMPLITIYASQLPPRVQALRPARVARRSHRLCRIESAVPLFFLRTWLAVSFFLNALTLLYTYPALRLPLTYPAVHISRFYAYLPPARAIPRSLTYPWV